ncbi:MAG TPA: FHA domain-containing protein [Pirellulales bacterium]
MEARLVVVGGKANKSEVRLKLPAMIGRSRDADVTVSHASVSRHHCLIYELEGALVVRDNGSLNGTVVDGQKIQESLLKPGQSLTIGPLTFRAEYEYEGLFPALGSAPAASNGQARGKPSAVAKAASPAAGKSTTAAGAFDFLSEEPAEPAASASEPSFNFVGGGEAAAPVAEEESPEPAMAAATHEEPPEVAEPPSDEHLDAEPAAEKAGGGAFDFLAAEAEEPAGASSAPNFNFLGGGEAAAPAAEEEAPVVAETTPAPDDVAAAAHEEAPAVEEPPPDEHLAAEPAEEEESGADAFGFLAEASEEPAETSSAPNFNFLGGDDSAAPAAEEEASVVAEMTPAPDDVAAAAHEEAPAVEEPPPDEHLAAESAEVEEALPDVHPDAEATEEDSGADTFGFLTEEAEEPADTSSKPSFGFLAGGDAGETSDEDDSGAIFRFADDSPPAKEKTPVAAGKDGAKDAAANGARVNTAEESPAAEADDAALNDFLNSLGLDN